MSSNPFEDDFVPAKPWSVVSYETDGTKIVRAFETRGEAEAHISVLAWLGHTAHIELKDWLLTDSE